MGRFVFEFPNLSSPPGISRIGWKFSESARSNLIIGRNINTEFIIKWKIIISDYIVNFRKDLENFYTFSNKFFLLYNLT